MEQISSYFQPASPATLREGGGQETREGRIHSVARSVCSEQGARSSVIRPSVTGRV